MTNPIIPDGPAPIPQTIASKMQARDAQVAENERKGIPYVAPTPVTPWAQYSRGTSGALNLAWQACGGYSLLAGTPPSGLSFNGNGGWTLGPGIWAVKAGLRISSSTSAQIFCLSQTNTGSSPIPYLGAEASFPNIDVGAWASLSTDIYVTTSFSVYPWVYITNSTPTIIDGVISFYQIG